MRDIIVRSRDAEPPSGSDETFERMATTGEVPAIAPESFPSGDPRR